MNIIASFADFEHELIVERTLAGLARARREGKTLGRPRKILDRDKVRQLREEGKSMRDIGKQLNISAMTASRILAA
jgi:putative DNA-invertase from lambdoid prophage Rac